jgi:hypothetical protein
VLLGGHPDFQMRVDALNGHVENIHVAKAYRLIDELILRDSMSFRPQRPSARGAAQG